MKDTEFDDLLRNARGDISVPDSFRSEVWNRIAAEGQRSPLTWIHSLVDGFVRPWSAFCGVTATVALGLLLGALSAPGSTDPKMAYAESISPFLQSAQR